MRTTAPASATPQARPHYFVSDLFEGDGEVAMIDGQGRAVAHVDIAALPESAKLARRIHPRD